MLVRCFFMIFMCLFEVGGNYANAHDDVYMAYTSEGIPVFSNQRHGNRSSLYLKGERNSEVPVAKRLGNAKAAGQAATELLIRDIALVHGVDPALVNAIVAVESGFNAQALSPKGAIGAMQLIPETAARYGVTDARDLRQNITAGTLYVRDLLLAYQGNLPLALAAYNAGQRNVHRYHKRIPPFRETMLYVPQVLAKMESYQY